MRGVHEDREGQSDYFYTVYRRGSIVRAGDMWGVVTQDLGGGNRYHSQPEITWRDDDDHHWSKAVKYEKHVLGNTISAPYAHTYAGIPDDVLAKATEVMLK